MSSIGNQSMSVYYDEFDRMNRRTRPGVLNTTDEVKYWYDESGHRIGKEYVYNVQVSCNDSLPPIELFGMEGLLGGGREQTSSIPPGTCSEPHSTLTGYYYFGDDLVAEYAGGAFTGGVLSSNYVYANGERIAKFTSLNDMQYYLTDHLGSVLCVLDNRGRVKNKTLYRPYGEVHAEDISTPDPHKYTGHERDEELGSPWDYLGQRYYIPGLKQFSQVDPKWELDPGQTPYGYCAGNPMKYVDPNGETMYIPKEQREFYDRHPILSIFIDPRNAIPGPASIEISGGKALGGLLGRVLTYAREMFGGEASGVSRKVVENTAEATTATITKPGATRKIGEDFLKTLGGQSEVRFETSQGVRYVDRFAERVAHESKVGYQSLTPKIGLQIAKDADLLQSKKVVGVTWHFFQSPVTGQGGASHPLLKELEKNGINIISH